MKKISKLILVFVLILIACSEDKNSPLEIQNRITAKDLEFVGIEHNLGLEKTLNFLTDNKKELSKLPVQERSKSLQKFLIDNIDPDDKYSNISDEIGENGIRKVFSEIHYNKRQNVSLKVSTFSEDANIYLQRIQDIVETTNSNNIENVISRISDLEIEIEQSEISFSDEELITLFSATQTAKYTSLYWVENIKSWADLSDLNLQNRCDGEDGPECYNDVVGSIAAGDVAGAVGGAVGAAVVNVIPGVLVKLPTVVQS